ncbi:hypothetical protein [Succinivibrio dextrinosolvens]|uniref:hypothetical protein n=1 Tax=Succinivibrio dextrinosolvens TaxID=83771 RepID=UPI0004E1A821|nr:hypothetical protein [Succinivibrio dextrinosolvens]MBE6423937.1 hypothetical protein [Succinivibrio dextrinosolvens]
MNKVFCISYSNFGYLLSEQNWTVEIRKLEEFDYGVYEDILRSGQFLIKRRFLSSLPDIFDDCSEKKSEPVLPEDIKRLILNRDDTEVLVIASNDFIQLFSDESKDEFGCVCVDRERITCSTADPEDLAEDVVILASCGVDLNNPDLNI